VKPIEDTTRRITVQVLLRGLRPGEQTEVKAGELTVFITGVANRASWPRTELRPDDLEGVLWTSTANLDTVVSELRRCPLVLAARNEEGALLGT